MSTVHLDFLTTYVALARWYDCDGPEGFSKHLPFKAVATLLWRGDVVEIHGMLGAMSRPMRQALQEALINRGAKKALAYRHGRWVDMISYERATL